jgi:hypothetical protein
MQLYMHWSGMNRAYYLAVNKDDDTLYGERVRCDQARAKALIAKARAIVTAAEPLERLSEKPEYYACKFCPARGPCHEGRLPPATCRSCAHTTPELDGDARWSCAFHKRDLSIAEQRAGCEHHVYIPALVPWPQYDANAGRNCVEYRHGDHVIRNGTPAPDVFASSELYAAQAGGFAILSDPVALRLRSEFSGRIVAGEAPRP